MIASIIRTATGSLDTESYKNITGTITLDGLTVDVKVIDARVAYGRLDFSVEPLSGSGSRWVSSSKVKLACEPVPSTAEVLPKKSKEKKVPMFREEVSRRKAENSKSDADETLAHIKSFMDTIIKKEENQ